MLCSQTVHSRKNDLERFHIEVLCFKTDSKCTGLSRSLRKARTVGERSLLFRYPMPNSIAGDPPRIRTAWSQAGVS